jgi:hypothetical protein
MLHGVDDDNTSDSSSCFFNISKSRLLPPDLTMERSVRDFLWLLRPFSSFLSSKLLAALLLQLAHMVFDVAEDDKDPE